MMELNKRFPEILSAYVRDMDCLIPNNVCNELTKFVSGVELERDALRAENETLNNRLAVAVSLKADNKDEFDWNVLDEIHKLRSILKECGEVIENIACNLPEGEIEIARQSWGNTNTRIIKDAMNAVHALMEKLKQEGVCQ